MADTTLDMFQSEVLVIKDMAMHWENVAKNCSEPYFTTYEQVLIKTAAKCLEEAALMMQTALQR